MRVLVKPPPLPETTGNKGRKGEQAYAVLGAPRFEMLRPKSRVFSSIPKHFVNTSDFGELLRVKMPEDMPPASLVEF
jgi:hypothetical protein